MSLEAHGLATKLKLSSRISWISSIVRSCPLVHACYSHDFLEKRENSDIEKLWEFLDEQLDDRLNLELEDNSIIKVRLSRSFCSPSAF